MSHIFCPVCRTPRDSDLRDRLGGLAHLQIALIVLAIAGIAYLLMGEIYAWRALLFYFPFWAAAEFVHWAKLRRASKCLTCDFDTVLYEQSPRAARKQVEQKMNGYVTELKSRINDRRPSVMAQARKDDKAVTPSIPPAT